MLPVHINKRHVTYANATMHGACTVNMPQLLTASQGCANTRISHSPRLQQLRFPPQSDNKIICLLEGMCDNMSLQFHKAINLSVWDTHAMQKTHFPRRLIYCPANLSIPANPCCVWRLLNPALQHRHRQCIKEKQFFMHLRLITTTAMPACVHSLCA